MLVLALCLVWSCLRRFVSTDPLTHSLSVTHLPSKLQQSKFTRVCPLNVISEYEFENFSVIPNNFPELLKGRREATYW